MLAANFGPGLFPTTTSINCCLASHASSLATRCDKHLHSIPVVLLLCCIHMHVWCCCTPGLTGGQRVETPAEPDTARSTAGLLSPTSSTSFAPDTPATPHQFSNQGSEPGNRGYLADGLTRWGSFTQEQLAVFG